MNELVNYSAMRQSIDRVNRFSHCSVNERILYTSFLLVIGIAYLVALANMFYTYESFDGKPGFSVEDVVIKYHGSKDKTRLGTALNGIMAPNLRNPDDKQIIFKWMQNGASETGYNTDVAPILNRDCVTCHTPAINPSLPNLTAYNTVVELTKSSGTPLSTLLRVAHIHLFGISFILVFVGKIFLLCEMNTITKRVLIALPFVMMVIDIASWFVTRIYPEFAYVIIGSGTLMGCSIASQILASIYQMWFLPKHSYVLHHAYE
jgi:hypothetical protein